MEAEVDLQVRLDGPGMVPEGHGLRDQADSSRHLRTKGCRGGQKTGVKLVCLGACDAGAHRGFALADGRHSPDDLSTLGCDLGRLDSRPDYGLYGRNQQPVFKREAAGTRISDGGVDDCYALFCRLETRHPMLLNH